MSGVQERAKNDDQGTYQTATEVAEVILQVAQAEQPPLRIRTSDWADEFTELKTATDPDGSKQVNRIIERFLK